MEKARHWGRQKTQTVTEVGVPLIQSWCQGVIWGKYNGSHGSVAWTFSLW